MIVKIEDVSIWVMIARIGYAVASGLSPSYTACGSIIWGSIIESAPQKNMS